MVICENGYFKKRTTVEVKGELETKPNLVLDQTLAVGNMLALCTHMLAHTHTRAAMYI